MIKNLIILSAGIAIGYYLYKNRTQGGFDSVIAPGAKSKDVEGMQKAFEKIADIKFSEYGLYDADTLASVQYLMEGTDALKDAEHGYLKASFIKDIAMIYDNSLKN